MTKLSSHRRLPLLLLAATLASTLAAACHQVDRFKDLNSVSITLERTACYGICPVYTATLDGSGVVKYAGERYVDIPGQQTAKIPPENVRNLLKAFEDIHFFTLRDKYTGPCTDLPTEFISLSVDGKTKRIQNYFCRDAKSGPQVDLFKLAQQIDSVAGTRRWIKCDAQCLAELIPAGLNVNASASDGTTPLLAAISRKNWASARLLLGSGAQTNVADSQDHTPLMHAAMANNPEMARELLAHGANVNSKNGKGFTALDMVAGGSEVQQVLLKAGAKSHGTK